ncbi:MAG: type II toxin-antitoxin system HicB family antitoxin [Actinobacteria bacterium]|nr:MAG: type II toxin-antitoxin system HicB family antitoxin [Actinomycetota bacterium]
MTEHAFDEYTVWLWLDTGGIVAEVAECSGCLAQGADANEALEMLRTSFDVWTAEMRSQGRPVPDPWGVDDYSGRFLLRMPTVLHARAAREAQREGVSLNQYVNVLLAERLGFAEGVRSVTAGGASLACEEPPGSQP